MVRWYLPRNIHVLLRSVLPKGTILRASQSQFHSSGLFELVDGFRIHYLRAGRGAHNLLLIPGPLGSAITDYTYFLENLNQSSFTAIAWDPPGQGLSITANERSWRTAGRLEQDAAIGLHLMRQLKLIPFSILGWAEGALTALLIFSNCVPDEVHRLIVWASEGAVPCPVPPSIRVTGSDALEPYRKISHWPIAARAPLEAMYGSSQLKHRWLDYLEAKRSGLICKNISGPNLESRLCVQVDQQTEYTKLLFMRTPGRDNTEDWLTYVLSKLGKTKVCNWMNQDKTRLEEKDYCWGPHRTNSREFQNFAETFLSFGECVNDTPIDQ